MTNQETVASAPPRRWVEAVLLVLAVIIAASGYLAIVVNREGSLPSSLALQLTVVIVGAIILHLLIRRLTPYADPIILPTALCLNGIGLAMIYRIDLATALINPDKVLGTKQAIYTLMGIIGMAVILFFFTNYKLLRRYTFTSMVAALILLLLPLVPFLGKNINGARIWIRIGFSIQPAELAKICLAIFFAAYLCAVRDQLVLGGRKVFGLTLPRLRDLGPLVVVWAFSLLILVGEKDLGTSLLIFGFFVAMLYVSTNQVSWLIIGFCAFSPAVYIAAKVFRHVQERLDIWLHALDPAVIERRRGSGQLVQGLFGMADGGLLGTGWAQGSPSITPLAQSDFIYTALGEELGFVGVSAILLLYLILINRGFKIAVECKDNFGKLLALGLSFTIAFQIFIVVGGVTRVIPSTGLTMPFIAAGGSSLISNWLIVGMLLRISDNSRRPTKTLADVGVHTQVINQIIAEQDQRRKANEQQRQEMLDRHQERTKTTAVPIESLSTNKIPKLGASSPKKLPGTIPNQQVIVPSDRTQPVDRMDDSPTRPAQTGGENQ